MSEERIRLMVKDVDGGVIPGAKVYIIKDRYMIDENGMQTVATDCLSDQEVLNPLIMDSNGLSAPYYLSLKNI